MKLDALAIKTVLIPLLPLLGFIILGLFRRKMSKQLASFVGCGTILVSFFMVLQLFNQLGHLELITFDLFPFIKLDHWEYFGFTVDHLSIVYLLVITGVGFLIHLYSVGYMHHESSSHYARYFAYLNLFVFSMLLLIMAKNMVVMFIGWEGVGLCSYLLIGYWFRNLDFAKAASKAFVVNRIGDLGLLFGMYMIYAQVGSLDFEKINVSLLSSLDQSWYKWAALGLFIGATGKSAQIPLFTWLPDAMAGPTPVSALIHAATMVTAGIYLVTRTYPLFDGAAEIQSLIAWIGVLTALIAATIATQQNDIKKVLAYSTVSQLGFMFIALGMGAYTAAIFHVITHAFFKALLFLGSGSVIHAVDGEQDMKYMGGLMKKMRITGITFWIGSLAIAGIPFFSGFFSKDEILLSAFIGNKVIWALASLAALLTAFYIFRALFLTFYGEYRGTSDKFSHVHESPYVMTGPLIVLALLAAIGGLINVPEILGGSHALENYICTTISLPEKSEISHSLELGLMGLAVLLAIIGIVWGRYSARRLVFEPQSALTTFFRDRWKIDELYATLFQNPAKAMGRFLDYKVDAFFTTLLQGSGNLVVQLAGKFKNLQSGKIGYYVFALVMGIIFVMIMFLVLN